ncbi:MAG: peptide-methionine (S)-S-oxide reductase MsrA [Bacteroidota bacterium]
MTNTQTAVLGGGCFWCTEAVLERLRGVHDVESGYAGGAVPNPTYREICSGRTGHAEVVRATFDPDQISYEDLLTVFFATHDPTTLNRQGADVGTQYRSTIMVADAAQRETAERVIRELTAAQVFPRPIVTEVVDLPTFYPAEQYHQDYYRANPNQGYCQAVIAPKVAKLRAEYLDKLAA